jgi:plastocyanin
MKKSIIAILIIAIVVLVGCTTTTVEESQVPGVMVVPSSSSSGSGALHTVIIEDGRFNPADIVINLGDTVEWINNDQQSTAQDVRSGEFEEVQDYEYEDGRRGFDHTVTFEDAQLDDAVPFSSSISHRFIETGEFRYFSVYNYHSGGGAMQGTVHVR